MDDMLQVSSCTSFVFDSGWTSPTCRVLFRRCGCPRAFRGWSAGSVGLSFLLFVVSRTCLLKQWAVDPRYSAGGGAWGRCAVSGSSHGPDRCVAGAGAGAALAHVCMPVYIGTRLLGWALEAQTLPLDEVLRGVFPRMRPPKLPAHTLASCEEGAARCVRRLLPDALLHTRQCCEAGACAHALFALGAGTFCTRCSAYAFAQVLGSANCCRGGPKDAAARWRLTRMVAGRHPVRGPAIGVPRLIEPALEAFHLLFGED